MGKLYSLRQHWRLHCSRHSLNPHEAFVAHFGAKAAFRHIGVEALNQGGRRYVGEQAYAIFNTGGGEVSFTMMDLEALASYAKSHPSAALRAHFFVQLEQAVYNYRACQPILKERSATAARPYAQAKR